MQSAHDESVARFNDDQDWAIFGLLESDSAHSPLPLAIKLRFLPSARPSLIQSSSEPAFPGASPACRTAPRSELGACQSCMLCTDAR
jgi:hypothetical protein